jgi:hypothetical protein
VLLLLPLTHSILFTYYFAFMKLYALFTLHETGWGTRQGIGEPEKAGEEAEAEESELRRGHYASPIQSSPRIKNLHQQKMSISRPSLSGASNGMTLNDGEEELEMKPVNR